MVRLMLPYYPQLIVRLDSNSFSHTYHHIVLVHGEPERNDMVEYFGELLSGYTFSSHGWVQSYGSRCVKPPSEYGKSSSTQSISFLRTISNVITLHLSHLRRCLSPHRHQHDCCLVKIRTEPHRQAYEGHAYRTSDHALLVIRQRRSAKGHNLPTDRTCPQR